MITPMMGNRIPEGRMFAVDTGCFSAPQSFDAVRYLRYLADRQQYRDRCLFATAPDVVGDARATLERSRHMLPVIRALGFKAALVAQDGLEDLVVPWDSFDCLFVGGTTAWKLSEAAYGLVREAKQRGKWCHMGRVNSLRRLRAARTGGYDSADGTFLAFSPDHNILRLQKWLTAMAQQADLFGEAAS